MQVDIHATVTVVFGLYGQWQFREVTGDTCCWGWRYLNWKDADDKTLDDL